MTRPGRAVEQHHGAVADGVTRAAHTHDGRNAQRVSQDRRMGSSRALLADKPDDMVAIELHGEPG